MIVIIPLIVIVVVLAWILRPIKPLTKPSRTALLATVIPPSVLAIAAVIYQLLQNASGEIFVSDISNTLFVAGLLLIVAGILVLAGFAIARKKEVVRSIGFGLCIVVLITILELGLLEWLGGV